MSNKGLEIKKLSVNIGHKSILRHVDLSIQEGELHVLLGPNGSGKSSLLSSIMGLAPFQVVSGDILYEGHSIVDWPIDQRANKGIGMTFQRPPSLDGVSLQDLSKFLKTEATFSSEANQLDLNGFEERQINVGFSGGEIKRWEVLKLFLQDPSLLLFDEPESGVDLEHIAAVGNAISRLMKKPKNGKKRSALIITHTGLILNYLKADCAHLMMDGEIKVSGDPEELFQDIKLKGYKGI